MGYFVRGNLSDVSGRNYTKISFIGSPGFAVNVTGEYATHSQVCGSCVESANPAEHIRERQRHISVVIHYGQPLTKPTPPPPPIEPDFITTFAIDVNARLEYHLPKPDTQDDCKVAGPTTTPFALSLSQGRCFALDGSTSSPRADFAIVLELRS